MNRAWKLAALCSLWAVVARPGVAQIQVVQTTPLNLNRKAAAALILSQTKPEYPSIAKVNYIQGKVRLQLLVSPEGRVAEANVVQGHPILAAAALKAVRRWLYAPFKTPIGPVPFVTRVDVNFALHNYGQRDFPPEADRDLSRQIRPPSLINPPEPAGEAKHFRVLVGDDGRALDINPIEGFPIQYESALKLVGHLLFRPAHWGPLTVPWYLDIAVPAPDQPPSKQAMLGQ